MDPQPTAHSTPAALERQLRQGFGRLRFAPTLEAQFRRDFEEEGLTPRLVLALIAIALISTQPLFDAFVLYPPDGFAQLARSVQFGVQIPMIVLAALSVIVHRWRRASALLTMAASLALALGLLWQRRIGADYGFEVPPMLVGVVIAAMFVLGGLRFRQYLPSALLILVVFAWSEIETFGRSPSSLYTIHSLAMLVIVSAVGGYVQEYHARSIWLQRKLLEQLSQRDALTLLLNPRAFSEAYRRLFAQLTDEARPLLVAVIDVDCFKEYNDCYGHAAGDDCLNRIAAVAERHGHRGGDLVARIGGEEFALVLPDVLAEEGRGRLEKIREAVRALAIPHACSSLPEKFITISIGACQLVPQRLESPDAALHEADMRLYESKRNGRNQVTLVQGVPARVVGGAGATQR